MPRDLLEVQAELRRARSDESRLNRETVELRARLQAEPGDDGLRERLGNVDRGRERLTLRQAELEQEGGQLLAEGLRDGTLTREPGTNFGPEPDRSRREEPRLHPLRTADGGDVRSAALRAKSAPTSSPSRRATTWSASFARTTTRTPASDLPRPEPHRRRPSPRGVFPGPLRGSRRLGAAHGPS